MRLSSFTISLAFVAATAANAQQRPYRALGFSPAWTLEITNTRLIYTNPSRRVRIIAANPGRRLMMGGHRYAAHELTVQIIHEACGDPQTGIRYADQVTVTSRGASVIGCGGKVLPGDALGGTVWRVMAIDRRLPARPGNARIAFVNGRLTATAGCNTMSAGYYIGAGRLTAGPLIGTQMACSDGSLIDEQNMAAIVAERPHAIRSSGDSLSLVASKRRIDLARLPTRR